MGTSGGGPGESARRRRDGTVALLGRTELFGALSPSVRSALAAEMTPVSVSAGSVLFDEGDDGDALFVIVRGRLRSLRREGDEVVVLDEAGPGQVVGELAVVSDRPRLAAVQAVRDSELLELSRDSFRSAVARRPRALLDLVQLLVSRLESSSASSAAASRVASVALLPAGATAARAVRGFGRALARALRASGPVAVVEPAAAADPRDALDRAEADADVVVMIAAGADGEWADAAVRHADRVLLVADVDADARPTPAEVASGLARRELVLLQPGDRPEPRGAAAWLDLRAEVTAHHHVRVGSAEDCRRVARSLRGRSVGLVLGGGGPRGFAHIGAVRAVREAGIPIDLVVGTSIGALMAVGVAFGWDADTMAGRAVEALAGRRAILRPTLPLVSLSSGRRVEQLLRSPDLVGDRRMEDALIPWTCVSTSLRTCDVVVHDRGPAWMAVRASMALPGILPPVYEDGDLLVDGGVLDNLPVDVARARGADRVIAVDLEPVDSGREHLPFDPSITGWQALARRIRATDGNRPPSALEVLLRTKQVGVIHRQETVLAANPVDLHLRPQLDGVSALDFRAGLQLIDAGYRHAVDALAAVDASDWV